MADSVSSESVVTEDRAARFWLVFGSAAAVLFVLTAVVVSPSGGIAQFDQDVMASMSALRHPVLTTVVQFITDLGSYRPVTLLSIMLALVVGFRTRRLLEPVVLLAAVEASSSLVEVLKTVTDRARPPLEGMSGAPVFDYSFPSGHTASGTVLYVLGAMLFARTEARSSTRHLLVAAGCVVGGLIGLSRVYLGYHWLTDVVGAWLLALILTSIGMAFVTANRRSESDIVLRNAVAPRDAFSRLTVSSPVADRTGQLVSPWSVNGVAALSLPLRGTSSRPVPPRSRPGLQGPAAAEVGVHDGGRDGDGCRERPP